LGPQALVVDSPLAVPAEAGTAALPPDAARGSGPRSSGIDVPAQAGTRQELRSYLSDEPGASRMVLRWRLLGHLRWTPAAELARQNVDGWLWDLVERGFADDAQWTVIKAAWLVRFTALGPEALAKGADAVDHTVHLRGGGGGGLLRRLLESIVARAPRRTVGPRRTGAGRRRLWAFAAAFASSALVWPPDLASATPAAPQAQGLASALLPALPAAGTVYASRPSTPEPAAGHESPASASEHATSPASHRAPRTVGLRLARGRQITFNTPSEDYRMLDVLPILDVWGEGRIDYLQGGGRMTTGFSEAYNLNMKSGPHVQKVSNGPDRGRPIPNLVPVEDYEHPVFPLPDNSVLFITLMNAPISRATAAEMLRVLRRHEGHVLLYDPDPEG
jgi:hypothetical protein